MSITNFLSILLCHSVKLGLTEWGGRHTANRFIYFYQQRVSGLSGLILLLCKIFSKRFNTMSAVFAHHLPALPQKNRFSRRFVLMQKGDCCTCRQNEYLFYDTAIFTLFWAICCKIHCVLVQNGGRFDAKCSAFWC